MSKFLMAAALAGSAGLASAQSFSFNADIENFGDPAANVFSVDFNLPAIDSIDSIEIELAHSWSNDLDLVLTGPGGEIFDITSDNGVSVNLGDGGSLLTGVALYTFVEAAGNGSWADFGFDVDAPGGTYDAETWVSGPFGGGLWNITLDDDANGDDGAVGRVTINYTIPAPASAALLGLGGLAAARRRR
ncbi:MAG: hypothetical protein AAGB48_06765 [Planctomycetota bacterium]